MAKLGIIRDLLRNFPERVVDELMDTIDKGLEREELHEIAWKEKWGERIKETCLDTFHFETKEALISCMINELAELYKWHTGSRFPLAEMPEKIPEIISSFEKKLEDMAVYEFFPELIDQGADPKRIPRSVFK